MVQGQCNSQWARLPNRRGREAGKGLGSLLERAFCGMWLPISDLILSVMGFSLDEKGRSQFQSS